MFEATILNPDKQIYFPGTSQHIYRLSFKFQTPQKSTLLFV